MQALYRRWRSQRFSEVVGQEHVTQTLRNALAMGRLAHAYLFCGPRGTGKTSTARILAKAVNCLANDGKGEPCNACAMCQAIAEGRAYDLIEIDAASNRGIDEIRALREKVAFAPAEARYKFYIIDEAHMLTGEAFNALLKTLEEPPPRSIFVLATTEAHKIPATVASRCQRFDFRRIPLHAAVDRLGLIARAEGIEVPVEGLQALVKAAAGSLRDAENLLDQLVAAYGQTITLEQVLTMLGMTGDERVAAFAERLLRGAIGEGLQFVHDVLADGVDLRQFHREVVEHLRSLLLVRVGGSDLVDLAESERATLAAQAQQYEIAEIVRALKVIAQIDLRVDWQTPLPLELALVEFALGPTPTRSDAARSGSGKTPADAEPPPARPRLLAAKAPRPDEGEPPRPGAEAAPDAPDQSASPTRPAPVGASASTDQPSPESAMEPGEVDQTTPAKPVTPDVPSADRSASSVVDELSALRKHWAKVLEYLHQKDRKIEAVVRDAEPIEVQGDRVVLAFPFDFHQKKVEEPKNRRLVEAAIAASLGRRVHVECRLVPRDHKAKLQAAAEDPLVKEAIRLFGAKIVDVQ